MNKINDLLIKYKWFKYCIAAFCGLLTAVPMVVPQLFFLTWVSLIPLFYVIFVSPSRIWLGFKLFFIYGFFYFVVVYTWFLSLNAFDNSQNSSFVFIKLGIWLAVSLVQALQFSLIGIILGLVKGKGFWKAVGIPFAWIIIEWVQEQTIWGMPWGRLATSQYMFLPAIQSASLLGSLFVSFIIVLINSLLAYAFSVFKDKKIFKTAVICAAGIFVLNTAFGLIKTVTFKPTEETVKIAAVQGSLPSSEKWEEGGNKAFNVYMELSRQAADEGNQIVVWPETAVPIYLVKNNTYDIAFSNLADEKDIYLVVATFIKEEEANYSVLVLYYPDGTSTLDNPYKKRHLVPFGEFVPYRDFVIKLLPALAEFRLLGEDVTPSNASSSVIFETPYGNMSGLICFDSIFTHLCQSDVKNGSELIIIGTNDSFYSNELNPRQHNAHAVFRAVENGKFTVRAANTGISSIITPFGSFYNMSEMNQRTLISADISFIQGNTLYSYLGNIIVVIAAAYMVFVFIYSKIKKA